MKCLLVDDVEDNLVVLTSLLRDQGVELLCARSGREALELLLEHEVALALLDVQMPEMDGFELAELMRGSVRTRDVPIIFVTAGSRDQHRVFKGYELGAVDFLFKPIEPHILRSKTSVFLQLFRQREQLAKQLDEKSETLRMNEMFMAILGHDLRNPLNAIMAAGHLLQRSSDGSVVKTANRVISSGRRMTGIIEQMLDVARSRLGGGIVIARESCDVGELVHRVAAEQQAHRPELRLELSEAGDTHGDWDPGRLGQLVSNLVGNAATHGDPSAPVQIGLDGTRTDAVILTISNAGSIPEAARPHLFDAFRGRETGRGADRGGLGLGLYIVRQIALAHGGTVQAQLDQPNRTSFIVELPRSAS